MHVDTEKLISAALEPENVGHTVLFGIAGEGENTTIGELHLSECHACGAPETPIGALRHFALETGAEEALLAMPHPVVALAYAITEPHIEWNPDDPYRYTPPGDHPEAVTATTIWIYTTEHDVQATRISEDGHQTPVTLGAVEDDRALTALAALVTRLKRALAATPAM